LTSHSFFFPRAASAARSFTDAAGSQIGLTTDQVDFQTLAQNFADAEMKPFASEWDQTKHFPKVWPYSLTGGRVTTLVYHHHIFYQIQDVLKKAAELGFGGVYVKDDVGG
jgi:isobutyryl-CoA dehydrogenase